MSAGGVVGLFFNLAAFAGIWIVVGVVVDKIGQIFNMTIQLMPTYQDAVNGFSMMQTIYGILPVIVFIALVINYFVQENSACRAGRYNTMATTLEMYIAGLALIVNSLVILIMFFLGNVMLGPIIYRLEQLVTGPQVIPMTDMTYLIPSIWAILIIMEIICIAAFFIVSARRTVIDDYY